MASETRLGQLLSQHKGRSVLNGGAVKRVFQDRVQRIPPLGLGLSVDVYSPDLFELMGRFVGREFQPAYLEIFRATTAALESVRVHLPAIPLAYHGEGLWITQPDFSATSFFEDELDHVASHVALLNSPWLNHECATKQMAGYSFGTYLPPLYTPDSARVVAGNIDRVQAWMDRKVNPRDSYGPLFLLEMPPLTYFMAGTMPVPDYFRLVTELTPCGLVLDIGHLWTVYRYTVASRECSLEQFIERFMNEFPVDRVVEIHVAGLAVHAAAVQGDAQDLHPPWIDAHAAPIPAISWKILGQVLADPRLVNLRGLALEVDTKSIEQILEEFQEAAGRFSAIIPCPSGDSSTGAWEPRPIPGGLSEIIPCAPDVQRLQNDYASYAKIACGRTPPAGAEWHAVRQDPAGLGRYIDTYLPNEILHWGGDVYEMFPETCRCMGEQGIAIDTFVTWWFRAPQAVDRPYDYFLLKIHRFLEFVSECAPLLLVTAGREAEVLRTAYADASDVVRPLVEPVR